MSCFARYSFQKIAFQIQPLLCQILSSSLVHSNTKSGPIGLAYGVAWRLVGLHAQTDLGAPYKLIHEAASPLNIENE